ncbi:MAG: DNA phosphorothioation system sulfurtransferase DndC [Burkholderiales bacterium]|nr:DNA phosphorothioation system sulfurtransferase DndC [Burkholderiales bacterium]
MPIAPDIIIKEIQALYAEDTLPWVVGYSGGKDSTASLQLIWKALEGLPESKRSKPVHVISTDTLVENPVIAAWVEVSLGQMKIQAMAQRLPVQPHRLTPSLENRFWVNLIGKGYPTPRPKFRWCTDRLKISASTKFIQELSEANGEAILVLGQRRGESQARDKVMDQYGESSRRRLSRNKDPKLSRVWVYLPIETWSSDDVWEYIVETPNPWGVSNQELFNIYRGATPDAECPIVVDKSTPSCGDSRFGCYVCTMVTQDRSMKAMIHNDEEKAWMQPIMDFRDNFLVMDDREHRDFRRMNGQLILMNGRLVHGPYSQERRSVLLRELLQTQRTVQRAGTDKGAAQIELIPLDELQEIRRIWVEEKGEIEDVLPGIYEQVFCTPYPGSELDPMPLDHTDLALLRQVVKGWTAENLPSGVPGDSPAQEERSAELYKLTRTLLAASFRGLQSRKRSKQLDELEGLLSAFAFVDEKDALAFAEQHLSGESGAGAVDVAEAIDIGPDEFSDVGRKIIPIRSDMSPLA